MSKLVLLEILENLKKIGCSGIKISFEDEGAQLNEVITMRYLTAKTDLELSVKIGGGEAKRDLYECGYLCPDIIIGPMIETKFSLEKFIKNHNEINKETKLGFNLETITTYDNLQSLMPQFSKLDYLVFGRVDFVSSIEKDRDYVESDEILKYVEDTFRLVKNKYEVKTCLGGAISLKSQDFIKKLNDLNLLDKFETRYVIFDLKKCNLDNFEKLMSYASKFELEWLKYVQSRYKQYMEKDNKRIIMIENRFKSI